MKKNIRFDDLFKTYAPPEGGIHGLNEKLKSIEKKHLFFSFPKIVIASTVVAMAFLALIISTDFLKPKTDMFHELVNKSNNPIFIKYGYLKKENKGVSILADARSRLVAVPVKTSNKNVKFYLIKRVN